MSASKVKKKFGLVLLLDALGASHFIPEKIREFLSARSEINSIIKSLAKQPLVGGKIAPNIFTFGDTIIVTIE
jgi:hypothetical protein